MKSLIEQGYTLGELLSKIKPDVKIKIGCNRGTNMIYASRSDGAEKYLELVYEDTLSLYKITLEQKQSALEKYKEKDPNFIKLKKEIGKLEKKIQDYKPFMDRKIIDLFMSTYEEGVVIAIIEGNDWGDYWTCGEYEKGLTVRTVHSNRAARLKAMNFETRKEEMMEARSHANRKNRRKP